MMDERLRDAGARRDRDRGRAREAMRREFESAPRARSPRGDRRRVIGARLRFAVLAGIERRSSSQSPALRR